MAAMRRSFDFRPFDEMNANLDAASYREVRRHIRDTNRVRAAKEAALLYLWKKDPRRAIEMRARLEKRTTGLHQFCNHMRSLAAASEQEDAPHGLPDPHSG